MSRSTENLIRKLAHNSAPIRPLARPWIRAVGWLTISGIYMAIVVSLMKGHGLPPKWDDPRFILEQVSALAVGVGAAVAAFATIVPGHNRSRLAILLIPLAGWLGTVGEGCIHSLIRLGPRTVLLEHDLACFSFIALSGTVPALFMALMLRQGAPLTPRLTAGLGALAAAGLANFFLRIFHPEDVTLMLLFWHVGGVLVLSALAASAGRYLLNWPSITRASENTAR
jgi:hypothetical protein